MGTRARLRGGAVRGAVTAGGVVVLLGFAGVAEGQPHADTGPPASSGAQAQPRDTAGGQSRADTAPASELSEWGRSLEAGREVGRELGRYTSSRGAALAPEYRDRLAARVRADIFAVAGAQAARAMEGWCEPSIEVSFGEEAVARTDPQREAGSGASGGADPSGTETRFEEGMVRVEVVACFRGTSDPEEALDLYTAPDFRMEAEPRIRSIWEEGGESCVETKGVSGLLAPTLTCHRVERLRRGGFSAEHSQLVRNAGATGAGVDDAGVAGAPGREGRSAEGRRVEGRRFQDVYFKESLKTFVKIPGGVAFHYVNVTRSGDLGRIERWVGSGAIRDGEKKKVEALRKRL